MSTTQSPGRSSDGCEQGIEQRVKRLESALRRQRWCIVIAVLAACGLGAAAAREKPADQKYIENLRVGTLEVEKSIVVDKSGKRIIVGGGMVFISGQSKGNYTALHGGSVTIAGRDNEQLLTPGNMIVFEIDQRIDRAYRELLDRGLAGLSEPERSRFLQLQESRKKPAVSIAVTESGGGMVKLYNSRQKQVVNIQSNKTNQGAIYLSDVNGKVQKTLSVD